MKVDFDINIVLEEGGRMPKKEFEETAGYDLFVPKDVLIPTGRSIVPLNFKMQLPQGYGAFVFSRSGTSAKGTKGSRDSHFCSENRFDSDVMLGLIDCDYTGTCGLLVHNYGEPFFVKEGESFAQMVIMPVMNVKFNKVTNLPDTDRGEQGFNA